MPLNRSELSSIAESLAQLSTRITAMAEELQAEREDHPASELFAVERTLHGAHRRLDRLIMARR